ncbi:hypothetical protein [Jidongwangia harbinensis]|uniref:hypothetical protein n=1 Tax=Jidongwangia harbinensis TaxID=2878561 RepID=UPI001CDA24F8|nr:hypothetical protein [Jidongwangia harbinensis]MCA2212824.1 hypothetical protein [Jidongwangia harbinensis]
MDATHPSSAPDPPEGGGRKTREVTMFATIKSLIPEPRQAEQPRRYVGKHRQAEPMPEPAPPAPTAEENQPAAI